MNGTSTATIAILMTDMVGSTRQWEADREGMWAATCLHDEIADRVVAAHGGQILKARGEGDSLLILFPTAHQAVLAAIALNLGLAEATWPQGIEIKVRAAIHVGDMVHGEHDVYGPTPNRCARIRSLAGAEEILLSEATYNLARAATDARVAYEDRGEHRLKDLSRPERIYQVVHTGLPMPSGELWSLAVIPNNLPIQVSRFIGREQDITRVSELVQTNRLVSLTGLSGIGKSRLALQVGADLVDRLPGGVWYVDLHEVAGSHLISEIAISLGIESATANDTSGLAAKLGGKRALLVLDHCDRVQGLATELSSLLADLPNLHILLASQERLGVPGEVRYRVPLLAVDTDRESTTDASLLFLDRARLVRPEIEATPTNLEVIQRIVRRLEGLPLAIELAAARVSALSMEQIATRLDDSFRLISGAERGLSVAFQESIGSLAQHEAALLPRLAMFEGATFETFERFSREDGVDEIELLDMLQVLIDRSLIDFRDWLEEPRYTMLNSIREHVFSTLPESVRRVLADRHALLFLAFVESAYERYERGEAARYMSAIGPEYGNVRTALQWFISTGSAESAQQMVGRVFRFWEARGMVVEGRDLAESSLRVGSSPFTDDVHNAIGALAVRQGDFEAGRRHHLAALELRRTSGKTRDVVGSLNNLANLESDQGHLEEAERLYLEALEMNRQSGNRRWEAINLVNLGTLAHRQERFEAATEFHRASLAAFSDAGMPGYRRFPLIGLGNSLIRLERLAEAHEALSEALRIAELSDDQAAMTVSLEGLGTHAIATGDFERGVRLLAVARRLRDEIQLPYNPQDEVELTETLDRARSSMGDSAYDRAWKQGLALPREGLV